MMRIALAVLAVGCGGSPAAPFVGTWTGTETVTLTPSTSGSSVVTDAIAVEEMLSENLNTGDVDFSGCRLSGTPSGERLALHAPVPCVLQSGGCALTTTITTGSAVARGNAMTVDYGGSYSRDCSGVYELGTFAVHANLTRK